VSEPAKARKRPSVPAGRPFQVALYGATGFTGRLAAQAMRDSDIETVLAGRDQEKLSAQAADLGGLKYMVAGHGDTGALGRLAQSARVLVSCAGPFGEVGELAVAAAVSAGCHYLDSTGESDFMAQTHRRHHRAAKEAGITVINSFAFEYVLGDCAVELALRRAREPVEVDVAYWVSDPTASRGTVLSASRILSSAAGRDNGEARRVHFPDPVGERWTMSYPGGEVELLRRRRPDLRVRTYMSVPPIVARTAGLARGGTRLLGLPPLRAAIKQAVKRMPAGPDDEQRRQQRFVILVEVTTQKGKMHRVRVDGVDAYGLTGVLLARGASWLLDGKARASGVLGPAEAFEPEDLLDSLKPQAVTWSAA